MAKIVYFKSPLNKDEKKEITYSGYSIGDILKNLGISRLQLSITINGETPDDIDLDYVPTESDVIEIRRPVEGGGSSGRKSTISTIVQIAAIAFVVSNPLGWGATALLLASLAGQVVAGVFQKWAMDLAPKATGSDYSEVDTSSNNYSLTSARNEARQLAPMPLLMGSLRYPPDVYAEHYRSIFNEDNTIQDVRTAIVSGGFIPGVEATNGASALNNNWATMPAGHVDTGFPLYQIKIAPYHFNIPLPGPISPALNTQVINDVKQRFLDGSSFIKMYDIGSEISPLVIFHSDPTDPFYGRYSLFHLIEKQHREFPGNTSSYTTNVGDVYNGITTNANNLTYFFSTDIYFPPVFFFSKDRIQTSASGFLSFYPDSVGAGDLPGPVITKYKTFLDGLNGNFVSGYQNNSYAIEMQVQRRGMTSVIREGIPYATQVMNYGLGDLVISERRIGSLDVDNNDLMLAGYSPMRREDPFKWDFIYLADSDINFFATFHTEVTAVDNKSLKNIDHPTAAISTSDFNQYNFAYFRSKPGCSFFSMTIAGNLYETNTSTGFSTNACNIEIQYKIDGDATWRTLPDSYITIQNNNTKRITYRVTRQSPLTNMRGKSIDMRVRKMDLETENNDGARVCNLSIEDIRFYKDITYYGQYPDELVKRIPCNLEGLSITAMVSDYVQTNKYTAQVESKCWVYDFDTDTWNWESNRNPAFWFLYFARGGFLNENYDGVSTPPTYPNSPTAGWVSYPGVSGSTDHLFGIGLTDDSIDIDKIVSWAEFCDEKELYFDLLLKDDTSGADVLERIANVGRGSVTYVNGKLSVIFEDPESPVACLFGMGNIIAGSFAVDYLVADPVTKVSATYIDRETWESKVVEGIVPFTTDEYGKVIDMTLEGVTESDQAQREVNILAARQFYQRRSYSWSTDQEGILAKRGDLAYLSHDSTQYGFSGRIKKFIVSSGVVTGIQTTAFLYSYIKYVTIRRPDGLIGTYECTVNGDVINFIDIYPIAFAPFYVNDLVENNLSDYEESIAEDFVFIAGEKETPGKLVRISEVTPKEDGTYDFKAIDEDPAMWAYEYEVEIDPESFDDSDVVLSIKNVEWKYLGDGLVQINWETVNGDFIQILNTDTGLPVEANGAYSFSGGQVILELVENQKYNFNIVPFSIGTPYKAIGKKIVVWSK